MVKQLTQPQRLGISVGVGLIAAAASAWEPAPPEPVTRWLR